MILRRSGSLALILLSASIATAQYAPTGITQWSTQIQAGPVSIDMANGAMTMIVPVRHKAGSPPFAFDLIGNFGNMGAANSTVAPNIVGVLRTGDGFGPYTEVAPPQAQTCGTFGQPDYTRYYGMLSPYYMFDSTGAKHTFLGTMFIRQGPSPCGGDLGPMTVAADDGSGYTIVVTGSNNESIPISISLYNRDGLTGDNGGVTDPDGNAITHTPTGWQDSLGQIALNGWTYTDENGNPQSVSLNYAPYSVATAFTCTQGGYSLDTSPTTRSLPSSIIFPTGAQYTFSYESTPGYSGYVTGRPSKITLPSGGYIAFQYGNGNAGGNSIAGYNCVSGVIPWLQVSVNDGNGNTSTTTYLNSANSGWVQGYKSAWFNGPGNFTITETDSIGDVTTHYFWNELEEERIISDVNQGVLSTTITCYYGGFSNCATAGYSGGGAVNPITQRDVYTYDGAVGSVAPKLEETKYDIYGNVTQVSNYDYGASYPPSTAPVSTTTMTYDINGACGTLSNPYIYDRPCSITTASSAGTVVSQTNYTYNATGHVTQTSHWVAGSTYTTSSATYNSNGTIATTTDGNSHTTSFTYKACNGLFPTLTTLPSVNGVTQSTSQTWNCDGGVMTGSTDANGKTTTYTYADPIWRQTAISYPDGGSITTVYSTGSSSPWTISTSTAINGGSSLNKKTVYDGLARVTQTQVTSDPIDTDSVDTTYDLLGRIHSTSNPHRSSPSTYGITIYGYDALNRIILVSEPDGASESTSYSNYCKTITNGNNAHKLCSDGLGRLINVWEDPGLAPHLNYETDYGYDALGNLTSVTQKGGLASGWQARSFAYDGLSRLTSASNPESGSVTYSYDGNGNVTSKTSPQVNALAGTSATQTVSYTYDALNRLSGKSYSDGITPSSCYQYDSPVTAAGDANALGRMTLEWTQAGSCPSSSTRQTTIPSDAFSARAIMSHDAMGRVVSEQQYTPASQANGIIYVPQYNYDYAGDLVASTDGITAVPNSYTGSLCSSSPAPWATLTWTNCYDSAEHLTSVTSNWGDTTHPPSLFFGATYTAPGGLAAANYGNGTTLIRTYDNRLRVTGETDSGLVVTSSTPGIAAVQITGAEQSK